MLSEQGQEKLFFVIGLAGIIATATMVGAGSNNLWNLFNANPPFGPTLSTRGLALYGILVIYTAVCDLIGLGVIFAGGVIVVQRLRGRI